MDVSSSRQGNLDLRSISRGQVNGQVTGSLAKRIIGRFMRQYRIAGNYQFPRVSRPWTRVRCRLILFAVAAVGSSVLSLPVAVHGEEAVENHGRVKGAFVQAGAKKKSPQMLDVFPPTPHDLTRHISRAQKAINEERYGDAVDEVGALLNGSETEDYFLDGDTAGTHRSLKAEARRLLGEMPEEGRRTYQLRYGPQASVLLNQAVGSGSLELLARVSREFFHTDAGYRASLLLGRYYLDRGEPVAGAICLSQLVAAPASEQFEPELSLLLATCWWYAQFPERAEQTLIRLKQKLPSGSVRIGNETVSLKSKPEQSLIWLESVIGKVKRLSTSGKRQWLTYRGDASRNASSAGGRPLAHVDWRVPTPNDPTKQKEIEQQEREYVGQNLAIISSLHPLAVRHVRAEAPGQYRNIVLARTPGRLIAVDFESGERIWYYPPRFHEDSSELLSMGQPSYSARAKTTKQKQLFHRIWENAPYGEISADSERVYLIDTPDEQSSPWGSNANGNRLGGRIRPGQTLHHNQLVALELSREGYLSWAIDGESGLIEGENGAYFEPRLQGGFFLGSPLVTLGELYVLAEVKGDVRLVSLEPKSGRYLWSQQLCHVEDFSIHRNPLRRSVGAIPSYADGVLVCPTSAGAVVAVDATTRSLLWGYQYVPTNTKTRTNFAPARRRAIPPRPLGRRWTDVSVTLAEGAVIVTPVETDNVHCLNLLDGSLRWGPVDRDSMLYVGCVQEGNIVFVGRRHLEALSLRDGKQVWQTEIPSEGMPSGRGFLSGNQYYLPTTSGELVQFNTQSGKVVASEKTVGVLGNLLCYQAKIISHGTTDLSAYYQIEALERIVLERLAKNSNDAWALSRQGQLHYHSGQYADALRTLQHAYRVEQTDDSIQNRTRELLVDSMLALLRDDFGKHEHFVGELQALVKSDNSRAELLRVTAAGLEGARRYEEAFTTLTQLIDLNRLDMDVSASKSLMPRVQTADLDLRTRPSRWVQRRLVEVLANASADERARMDVEIERRYQLAVSSNKAANLRYFVEHFGSHQAADKARLALAQLLIGTGDRLAAEWYLTRLHESAAEPVMAQATAQLAVLFERQRHFKESIICYRRLAQRWGETVCLDGKTGHELWKHASENPPLQPLISAAEKGWLKGNVKVDSEKKKQQSLQTNYRVLRSSLGQVRGVLPASVSLEIDSQYRVHVRDGLGISMSKPIETRGHVSGSFNYTASRTESELYGHLAIIRVGERLLALNSLELDNANASRVLWSRQLSGTVSSETRGINMRVSGGSRGSEKPTVWGQFRRERLRNRSSQRSVVNGTNSSITENGICFQRLQQVSCVNPLDADQVYWIREGVETGSELFGDEHVLLIGLRGNEAIVVDMIDGQVLGRVSLPPSELRWRTFGRKILAWEEKDESLVLRMIDPWDPDTKSARAETVVWERTVSKGSKACLIDHDELGVFQPDGHFTVLSLADGVNQIETTLEPDPNVNSVYILRSTQHYTVVVNQTSIVKQMLQPSGKVRIRQVPGPGLYDAAWQASPLISGKLYGFDRQTGKALWPKPVTVNGQSLPLGQARELPLVMFMVNEHKGPANRNSKSETKILCVDKQTGRTVMSVDGLGMLPRYYQIRGDVATNQVRIDIPPASNRGGESLRCLLEYTDTALDPAADNAANVLRRAAD